MKIDLTGKNALVCGGSKGIGKASAIALAELGANVTLVSRTAETMAAVIKELKVSGSQDHTFLAADFSDPKDLSLKVKSLVAGTPIHILINNTGGPKGGPILDAEVDEFRVAFQQHLLNYQMIAKIVVPKMKAENYGRIINVISTSVKTPIENLGVSNTIRAAVANWSKTLATELGPTGITVNNVLPGFTDTTRLGEIIEAKAKKLGLTIEQTKEKMQSGVPMRRFGDASEIAAGVAFLASPAASYITGTSLTIDGGRTKTL